ncbi:hypothetical protein E4T38_07324 [Aureobasidium subglaciale]|nr:hypothetical protein E4T38_07324 [Aureobasidium subglaciale]KAI5217648.1 hypothetical protein E4T40_07335 [Aureobasidium subglaciale]KAI5221182.1 hypothetical protein E4T41_07176 [Aureobasidium subglaciale]KAI5258965.1 hypothetical protein E4T46_07153 [Aureobasidium subglaciale]
MAEGLEFVSTMISRYQLVEKMYLSDESENKDKLKDEIVKLYVAILRYLGIANSYYGKSKYKRIGESVIKTSHALVHEPRAAIEKCHCEVSEMLKLMDADSKTLPHDDNAQKLIDQRFQEVASVVVGPVRVIGYVDRRNDGRAQQEEE